MVTAILPHQRPQLKFNLTGQRFTLLLVIGYADKGHWHCVCDCGNLRTIHGPQLRRGRAKSCGCKNTRPRGEVTTNEELPEYEAYASAKGRCFNPTNHAYNNYGGRGIEFRFTSFEEFFTEVGQRPSPYHQLERIDNNGHYEKGNVTWATAREQANNRRSNHCITFQGKTQTLANWCRELNLFSPELLSMRLRAGWNIEKALTTPPRPQKKRNISIEQPLFIC